MEHLLPRVFAALVAALLVSFAVVVAPAAATGAWTPTGSMTRTLALPQSALLPSGSVLVVGGAGGTGPVFNAQIYNPGSGTWSPSTPMNADRGYPAMQVLADGRVLVAGGFDTVNALSSAEIYDPTTGDWTATGSLTLGARIGGMTQLLPSGKVLVFGGSIGYSPTSTAELYDPVAGTWSATGSMLAPREGAVSQLLGDGTVLVAGDGASAELYDPLTGTWSATGGMGTARTGAVSALLPSGEVLVAGGYDMGGFHSSAELYDPLTHVWSPTGSMSGVRVHAAAQVLPSGEVLVAGGTAPQVPAALATAELYDPASGTWGSAGTLATAREHPTAQLLANGKVLLAGGFANDGFTSTPLASAELYGPAPPTATIVSGPADPTRATTATFTFQGAAETPAGDPLSLMCSLDGAAPSSCAASVASGAVRSITYTGLADGTHTFSVYAVDGFGTAGAAAGATWHVDTHAPTVALTGTPADPTNATGATFSFAGDDTGGPVVSEPLTYECRLDTAAWGACTSARNYSALADGTHTFRVRATDAVGNVGAAVSFSWLIDTVPPQITITWPQEGGHYSIYKSVETAWTCTDDSSGVDVQTSTPAGNHQLLPKVAGPGVFRVDCTDRAGNPATEQVGYTMATFEQIVLGDHPIAYYRLDEPMEAETISDFSGNGHDGEYKNDTAWEEFGISGDNDSARRFIGEGGYVFVNGIQAPQYTLTLGGWVYFEDAVDASILDHGHDAALYLRDGHLTFRMMGRTITDPATVSPGQWYFVAGTWNRWRMDLWKASGTPGITNLPGIVASGLQPKRPTGTSTFYIGYGENVPWLRGVMDEVFYYARPLKAQQITELWLADPPARTRQPLARVAVRAAQHAGTGIVLSVRAVRTSITATATGRIAMHGRAFTLVPATRHVARGATAPLRVRIPAAAMTPVRRALAHGERVTARVTVRVRDAAGTTSTRRFTVRLTR